jgi:hypothetical protein
MIFSTLIPSLGALATASFFVVISNNLSPAKRGLFQISSVVTTAAGCVAYINSHDNGALKKLVTDFTQLEASLQFTLSLCVICVVFIGGGFYAISVTESSATSNSNETPATSDYRIDFEVPVTLPSNDTEFFEAMFEKFTKEIVEDLPTIYEMPAEAVEWVRQMIPYTVYGGKMNRGLAVLAVQKSFADHRGHTLSNKVLIIYC